MKHYVALFIIAIISFLSIFFALFYETNEIVYQLKIFVPGIAFSLFIVSYQLRLVGLLKSLLFLLMLIVGYYINFMIGLSSWGVVVPVAGGLGGALIGYFINQTHSKMGSAYGKLILLGVLSTLPGWLCFILTDSELLDRVGFGMIIALWQIAVGMMYLRLIEVTDNTEK